MLRYSFICYTVTYTSWSKIIRKQIKLLHFRSDFKMFTQSAKCRQCMRKQKTTRNKMKNY